MRNLKWIFLIVLFALTSCTTLSPTKQVPTQNASSSWDSREKTLSNLQNWDLKGLIAIRNAKNAWSANWQWHQNQKDYSISLFGPLASGSVQLSGSPNAVLLETSDGKKFHSSSPETLLEQQLGWRIPVSNLYYWVRGLPVPGVPAQKELDAKNRISVLQQQGWRIEYLRYATVKQMDLPSKIMLNNATLNVKIIINQWQF